MSPNEPASCAIGSAARELPDAVHRHERRAGDGPIRGAHRAERRDEHQVERDRQHRHGDAEPERRARVAGGTEGAAQHEEHHEAEDPHEHGAEERQRLLPHFRGGVHHLEKRGRGGIADTGHQHGQREGGQERLIDDAVDLLGLVGAGETGHEHGHPGEQGTDEDDDDEDDLPADADGGIAGVADEVADHRVVDDALQPRDDVLQHRRPRDAPDGRTDGAFDDGAIELSWFGRDLWHRRSVLRACDPGCDAREFTRALTAARVAHGGAAPPAAQAPHT
jgi:hypothetical protein